MRQGEMAQGKTLSDTFEQLGEILNPHLNDDNPAYKDMFTKERVAPVWKRCNANIPTDEVIALNEKTNATVVGFIEQSSSSLNNVIYNCVNRSDASRISVFMNCTHYILVSDLLKFEKE